MEWFFLILILAFVSWCAQMLMGFKRQSERIDAQIEATVSNDESIVQQAASYEAQVQEKEEERKELQTEEEKLAAQQNELESGVKELKQKDASRRPTRHRVDPTNS